MKHTCRKRNPLSLETAVNRDSASIASDDKDLWLTFRRLHLHTAKVRIVTASGNSIQPADIIRSKNFFRCTVFLYIFAMHTNHFIRYFLRKIQLMKGHNHSKLAIQYHLFEDGKKFQFMPDIQKRSRLIQDNNLRFLADGAGKKDSLTLTVTDRSKIAVL